MPATSPTGRRIASRSLAVATGAQKAEWLKLAAELVRSRTADLLEANEADCAAGREAGLSAALLDRLRLTESRLEGIARSMGEVAALPEPVGEIIDSNVRPNGLLVTRVRVPLGVVFFIYESRPNVTVDAAALCVKSGNAVILRGGKEAHPQQPGARLPVVRGARRGGASRDAVQLVETTDRQAVGHFLSLHEQIDIAIPRGGRSLIERVTAEATMPVLKHFDGICHVYVDNSADFDMAEQILVNSKCQRPGVCNAAETLLVHRDAASRFLPRVARRLREAGVELRLRAVAGPGPRRACGDRGRFPHRVSRPDPFRQGGRFARGRHRPHRSVRIPSHRRHCHQRPGRGRPVHARVDSAAVLVNASTRFNDGGEFGLGAEIGISTDKFHARGPCGLKELMSYKYVVHGSGQIRT